MFPQTLCTSSLSHKFSIAANLVQLSIWYCFLYFISFSFLRLNLSTSNFCAIFLLTASLSITFTPVRQWIVSQSAPLKDSTLILECHLLSINIWWIWLWVCPSCEVHVCLWLFLCVNIVLLTTRFFDLGKFTILTPLSLLSCCTLSCPTVGWKYSLPPLLPQNLLTEFSYGT